MNILIGGDLVPTESNRDLFNNGNIKELLGNDLMNIWKSADIRILNLETPLTDQYSPILKCGSNLSAPISTMEGIKKLNPSLLSLANNHILDHGAQGLNSTIEVLNENNIPFTGIGENVFKAREPYIFKLDKYNIGIYSCTENEFTIATDISCGANPFDPLESLDDIGELKKKCDYVIVLYHGGKEYYRYPSPYLQKICRKIVDKGADLVICQHSHCIGVLEEYKNSKIIYGQGNFIFDADDNEYWNTSIIVEIILGKTIDTNFIPICKNKNKIRLANNDEKEQIMKDFYERSKKIMEKGFIISEYNKLASIYNTHYLTTFAGHNRLIRKLNRVLNNRVINNKYTKKHILSLINYIECEAHRELILTGLKSKIIERK